MKAGNKFVIVSAGMIGVGILLSCAGYLMGGRVWGIGLGTAGVRVNSPNLMHDGGKVITYVEETENLEAFHSMDIAMEYGNVSIIPSDHYGIEYCVDSRYDFTPEVVNGCLVAKETDIARYYDQWVFWGIGGSSVLPGGQKDEYIKVYVPEETEFTTVKVYADFGEVECSGIKGDKLELDADFGDMSLSDMKGTETTLLAGGGKLELTGFAGETLTICNEFGDVNMENVESTKSVNVTMESGRLKAERMQTGELTVVQEFGDVILENVIVGGASDMRSESGGITLEQYETDSLIVNCDFGDVDGKEVAATTGNFTLESGACEIDWTKINTLTVESEFGDVKLTLPESVENYNFELETEFGDVRVDRADEGEHYHASVAGTDSVVVYCESGSIHIKGAPR